MRVFLSWSGEMAKELAAAVDKWLPLVIQRVRPFMSENIEKGARGMDVIASELEASHYGILFLTRENQVTPWINFEAGALSKNLNRARVSPVLFGGLTKGEVIPTLAFQLSYPEREEFFKLLQSVNSALGDADKLAQDVLAASFETFWPRLEAEFRSILERHGGAPEALHGVAAGRDRIDVLADTVVELRQAIEAQQEILRRLIPPQGENAGRIYTPDGRRVLRSFVPWGSTDATLKSDTQLAYSSVDREGEVWITFKYSLGHLEPGVAVFDEVEVGALVIDHLSTSGEPGRTVVWIAPSGRNPRRTLFDGVNFVPREGRAVRQVRVTVPEDGEAAGSGA